MNSKKKKSGFRKPDKLAVKGIASRFAGALFRYALLIVISFIILFPFISKISASFMSVEDMYDRTVSFIPRKPTLDNYAFVWEAIKYPATALRTLGLSLLCSLPQTLICACTGYALAKLKGKLGAVGMAMVMVTILIPPQIILIPMYLKFRFFDFFGITELLTGESVNLINAGGGIWPFLILSITGMAFKNGIYIFLLRQFYRGVPEELEEAAYIDGCSIFRTFFKIVLPISVPMMVTVFVLSFAWQWTDNFYTNLFLKSDRVLSTAIFTMSSIESQGTGDFYRTAIIQTAVLMSILPLVLVYIFAQKKVIAGIERSGITG
jgi:ABC transporter, permease protein